MRVALAAIALTAFLFVPYSLRRPLLESGSRRWLATFGTVMLLGIAASFISLLAIIVAPEALPLLDLPRAIDACIDGAVRILSHPLSHWPSIFASLILLVLLLRFLIALVGTGRDTRRARPPRADLCEDPLASRSFVSGSRHVQVLPTSDPVAYTTGLIRPTTVLSTGLLAELDDRSVTAVLAHESAHAHRGHMLVLFGARVLERAFGFIPSVRLSVRYVVMALEAAADDAAARMVGDRLAVAQAITTTARLGAGAPRSAPGAGTDEVAFRVWRLVEDPRGRRSPLLRVTIVALTSATLLAQGVAWSAGSTALSRERLALARHDTCHQPHAL